MQVVRWLSSQKHWLLIIDNLDDIQVIKGFLPDNGPNKHTLITTRNPNSDGIPAEGLGVPLLTEEDASNLFLIRTKLPGDCQKSRSESDKIVAELGNLPLAIDQAAAFIRETTRDLGDFLSLYNKSRLNRQKSHKWVPEGNRTYQYSVAITWEVSFSHIKNHPEFPIAAKLLQLFAFLNPDFILMEFVIAGADATSHHAHKMLQLNSRLHYFPLPTLSSLTSAVQRVPPTFPDSLRSRLT